MERSNCSMFGDLSKVWSEVKSRITWAIGDGDFINFSNNEWLTDMGPLTYIYSRDEQLDEALLLANMVG